MLADRIIVWSLAFALAFFPAITTTRVAQAFSSQIKATVLDYKAPAPVVAGGINFTPTDAQSKAPVFGSGNVTINIGSPSADRIVFFCFMAHTGGGIAAPTITGQTVNLAAGNSLTADQGSLFYSNITTGTTATIIFAGGSDGISVAAGILTGQSGGGSATPINPVAPGGNSGGGNQPLTLALTVPAGGIGIACNGQQNTAPGVYTWTGTTSSSGDETSAGPAATTQTGLAHSTATGTVTASSTSFTFQGFMSGAAMAP